MFDVGGGELLFIVLIILLLFGPKKIPELMRSFGSGLRHFRRAQEDLTRQIRDLSTQDPTVSTVGTPRVMHDVDAHQVDQADQVDVGTADTAAAEGHPTDGIVTDSAVDSASPEEPAATNAKPIVITPTPAPSSQPRPRRNDAHQEPPNHD